MKATSARTPSSRLRKLSRADVLEFRPADARMRVIAIDQPEIVGAILGSLRSARRAPPPASAG
jgi:hypothetical protein